MKSIKKHPKYREIKQRLMHNNTSTYPIDERVKMSMIKLNLINIRSEYGLDINKKEKKAGRPKPNKCELCDKETNKIYFDHNHKTGKFRGWICQHCNTALGMVRDDTEVLRKMIKYIKKHDS